MKEEVLHFIWKHRLFDTTQLKTLNGEEVKILKTGRLNQDGGPDFLDAAISIGDTKWFGNVEIHIDEKDWFRHGHQHDPKYRNVILHVLYHAPKEVNLQHIPGTIALAPYVAAKTIQNYELLQQEISHPPCKNLAPQVPGFHKKQMLGRLAVERLSQKAEELKSIWGNDMGQWEVLFYKALAISLGMKINKAPFLHLTQITPLKLLHKHRNSAFQLEALLFGQAGFLSADFESHYPNKLKAEYRFLQQKYQLTPMDVVEWQFLRTRPVNFPTLRLAQLAAIFHHHYTFSYLLFEQQEQEEKYWKKVLQVSPSLYWKDHYRFDKKAKKSHSGKIGAATVRQVLINVVAPMRFLYGTEKQQTALKERAVVLLEGLPNEQNRISKRYESLDFPNEHAADSQAIIFLERYYCKPGRCLNCQVGLKILKGKG